MQSRRQMFRLNGTGRKEKAHLWVLIEARAIQDGISHGFRMAVIDITERKRMEEEINERTAELVLAKETAEAATKTKAAFLANMSHELRTPMNAVIGFSSLLLDESMTPEQKEFIEGIRKGGEALLAIINDILDFSRVEKEMELEHQPFSLKQCINESLDLVAVQASNKGLNLSSTVKVRYTGQPSSETTAGSDRSWSTCSPTPSSSQTMEMYLCRSPQKPRTITGTQISLQGHGHRHWHTPGQDKRDL